MGRETCLLASGCIVWIGDMHGILRGATEQWRDRRLADVLVRRGWRRCCASKVKVSHYRGNPIEIRYLWPFVHSLQPRLRADGLNDTALPLHESPGPSQR